MTNISEPFLHYREPSRQPVRIRVHHNVPALRIPGVVMVNGRFRAIHEPSTILAGTELFCPVAFVEGESLVVYGSVPGRGGSFWIDARALIEDGQDVLHIVMQIEHTGARPQDVPR